MFLDAPLPSKFGRIILSAPTDSDDESISALRAHPDTRRYLRYLPEKFSVSDARARRLERANDPTLVDFHIHTRHPPLDASSTLIGTTGIFNIDDHSKKFEVGILVSTPFFRGGYATEALYTVLVYAFETRGMHRAEFTTGSDNLAMRRWLEMAGANLDGTLRELWPDPDTGGYSDVCLYSVLKDEWTTTVKGRLETRINRT